MKMKAVRFIFPSTPSPFHVFFLPLPRVGTRSNLKNAQNRDDFSIKKGATSVDKRMPPGVIKRAKFLYNEKILVEDFLDIFRRLKGLLY